MVQKHKQEVTLERLQSIAENYHEIGARIEAIVATAKAAKVRRLELKLGTITGSHYFRIMDSLERIEADSNIGIRNKQSKRS